MREKALATPSPRDRTVVGYTCSQFRPTCQAPMSLSWPLRVRQPLVMMKTDAPE